MRVIVAGGRDFDDWDLLSDRLDYYLSGVVVTSIVSGCYGGADALGERYARQCFYRIDPFPPDWDSYGKAAGPIRNRLMAENADLLVAFWDGVSRGTADMIAVAREKGLPTRVVRY